MAYVKGSTIVPGDLNTFIGDPGGGADKALVAFSGAAAATNRVAALYGVGYGVRGYGQTAESLALAGSGTDIFSFQWVQMIDAMTAMESHQGIVTLAPPNSQMAGGQLIEAHESSSPTLDPFDINSSIALLDTNKLETDSGLSLNTVAVGLAETRATTWTATISTTVTATFTTSNAARHFFNSGGSLTVVGSHNPGSPTDQDIEWARIFSTEVGTWEFRASDTIRSGSGGSLSGSYYGLSTSEVLLYNGNDIGSGAYGANDVRIFVNYTGSTTTGAKGNVITIRVELRDQHTNVDPSGDIVKAGTTITFGHRHAGSASTLSGIEQPTWLKTEDL